MVEPQPRRIDVRTIKLEVAPTTQSWGVQCESFGCQKGTTEKKPYCTDHVGDMAHVSHLIQERIDHEQELKQVAERGPSAVSLNSFFVEEILLYLKNTKPASYAKLSQEFKLSPKVLDAFISKMKRGQLVYTTTTSKKIVLVHLMLP